MWYGREMSCLGVVHDTVSAIWDEFWGKRGRRVGLRVRTRGLNYVKWGGPSVFLCSYTNAHISTGYGDVRARDSS